jgi:O-antigen biosynthesis protein
MLRGHIDRVTRGRVDGWAFDDADPTRPVSLIATCNDTFAGRILANRYRGDLLQAGIGEGRHSFQFVFPTALAPFESQSISIRREEDGAHLPGSPAVLPPVSQLTPENREALANYLLAETDEVELDARIALLAETLDKLLDRRAQFATEPRHLDRLRRLQQRWTKPDTKPADSACAERPRALVIDERLPRPDRDAGSNAILSHVQSLQRLGFDVEFVAARELTAPASALEALTALGLDVHAAPYCASVEEVLRRRSGQYDLVYLHRVHNAARYGALARDNQGRARILYSVADLHHLRVGRQSDVERRPELALLARRLRLAEMTATATSDAVITHSLVEAEILRKAVSHAFVETVPWSVPLRPPPRAFEERKGVAFIGGFGHDPNRDAARWLVSEIMPRVRRIAPVECLLVGSELPDDIRRLCGEGVTPVGHVPDLDDIFARVRLTVAPLAYGAGVKGKVLDSLAAGIPCVCTPIAAEGLALPALLAGYVTDDADRIAQLIVTLHEDAALNVALSEAGRDFIAACCSESSVDTAMRRVVGQQLAARLVPEPPTV